MKQSELHFSTPLLAQIVSPKIGIDRLIHHPPYPEQNQGLSCKSKDRDVHTMVSTGSIKDLNLIFLDEVMK